MLRLLRDHKNVLLKGPPGTGKTRLLNEVAAVFRSPPLIGVGKGGSAPVARLRGPVAIVAEGGSQVIPDWMPANTRRTREVFRTVFHQNTKYREFMTGLAPRVGTSSGGSQFMVQEGVLYRASEYAKPANNTALLIIDEINRGPAVQVFGPALVAFERDKRLADDGCAGFQTVTFEIVRPSDGQLGSYALPAHLYVLAAMNEADTSVEPLDVAFLRRWRDYRLQPEPSVLKAHLGLTSPESPDALPEKPASATDVYRALVRAWEAANRRVEQGRGPEFRIGHGLLIADGPPSDTAGALRYVAERWPYVMAHLSEVFFGDAEAMAAALGATEDDKSGHPCFIERLRFADQYRMRLVCPERLDDSTMYALLRGVAEAQELDA